jgi:hypothetical protein
MHANAWVRTGVWIGLGLAGAVVMAAPTASVTLRTDADCALQVNAKAAGQVLRAQARELQLKPGPWTIACQGSDGPAARAKLEGVLKPGESLELALRVRWADLGPQGLLDRRSKLQWTRSDNGKDLNWPDAKAWCASQGEAWRLPSRAELEGLYNSGLAGEVVPCFNAKCKVPSSFQLSGSWQWSGQLSDDGRTVWYIYLSTGHPQQADPNYQLNARALCVRESP